MIEQRLLETLRKIAEHQEGTQLYINLEDAECCEDLGWAEKQPNGNYTLTEPGRRKLVEANSR